MQNIVQQLQTLLSQKRKNFSAYFIVFLKCAWSLEKLGKNDEGPSVIISESIVSERGCYWNV